MNDGNGLEENDGHNTDGRKMKDWTMYRA